MNFLERLLRGKIDQVKDWQDPDRESNPMPCPEITIEDVDPILYGRLLTEAAAAGATFNGIKASIQGLEFDWSYDEPTQTLHVTCNKKPFYASCDTVEERIRGLIAKAKEAV